ncbi:tripartite motif-containing protein 2-like [Porites lutea]|uniref:tripartite motif-containing protein 2-like n=1 Tax=Porites lutea TaxID=51062 RepID=UPI003CC5DBBE
MAHPSLQATKTTSGSFVYLYTSTQSIQDEIVEYAIKDSTIKCKPNVLACPECRQDFRISGNGNLGALPTNVRIDNLLDILAIKECNTTSVKCGNCDKKSEHSFYCFQCCAFWCDDTKSETPDDTRSPAFCGVPGHGKKELEFFCRSCEVAICYSCIAILHEGHPDMPLGEAANERKLHVKAAIESQKERVIQKWAKIAKIRANCDNINVQVKRINKDIQMFVDSIIVALEAKKQELLIDVENRSKQFLQCLNTQERESRKSS